MLEEMASYLIAMHRIKKCHKNFTYFLEPKKFCCCQMRWQLRMWEFSAVRFILPK